MRLRRGLRDALVPASATGSASPEVPAPGLAPVETPPRAALDGAPTDAIADHWEGPRRRSRRAMLGRRSRGRHRRGRARRWPLAGVAVLLVAAAAVVGVRLSRAWPPAEVEPSLPAAVAPGHPPAIGWPQGVQAAYAVPALGISAASGLEAPAPVASVTKLMTALLVLTDHPLALGQQGPSVTVTSADVTLYEDDLATGQTNIEVQVGEALSEYQLLEGMLVHSANNFADLLALYDAGSLPAFVAKMNAKAAELGMTDTRYADASGYAEATVSTAADQLRVAAADIEDPVFDQIVDMASATLPVAGVVASYTPYVGLDGVVGLKSGFTTAAGGCDVLGMLRDVGGVPVEVLVAVVGYRGGITDVVDGAGLDALSIARQVVSGLRALPVLRRGERVGTARAGGASVPVVSRQRVVVAAWPGQRAIETFHLTARPRPGAARGAAVGWVVVELGSQRVRAAVTTGRRFGAPSIWQRVL